MLQNPQETTAGIEWFAMNLPKEYLRHPQYFLYHTALETEKLKDTEENRRMFKRVLTEHQLKEGMPLPDVNQKDIDAFVNPQDDTAKLIISEQITELTAKYIEDGKRLAEAQRLAVQELFHREAPLVIAEMDESYFSSREMVERDLSVALEKGNGNNLIDLNTGNPSPNTRITTQTGETITWLTYLRRASAVLFGTVWGKHITKKVLNTLKELCGVILMDEKYFNNRRYIEADLQSVLQHAKRANSIADLTTFDPDPNAIKITTQTGETITWLTYLRRASVVLFGKSNCYYDALKYLKKICNIVISMDEEYFSNLEYVEADLKAALAHAKGDSIADLTSTNLSFNTQITTQSGKTVTWEVYLRNVFITLFGNSKGADGKVLVRYSVAIEYLKRLCNKPKMNQEYFNNPEYVSADLKGFLEHTTMYDPIDNLNRRRLIGVKIIASNGEKVSWDTYLTRASKAFFGTKRSKGRRSENPPRRLEALKRLKQIAANAYQPDPDSGPASAD